MVAQTLEQDLASTLEPGERLLWSGLPRCGVLFRPRDIILIPLSLVWLGLAVAWEWLVFTGEPDVPDTFDIWDIGFALWGIPFVVAGFYFVLGRFVTDAHARANTIYGLTDRRVTILQALRPRRRFLSLDLAGLNDVRLSEGRNGRGTISFGSPVRRERRAFEGIAEPRDVLQRIRDAQRASRTH